MKKIILILLFAMVLLSPGCEEPIVPRPDHLIKEKQMIEMLVDMHLAEATQMKFRYDAGRKSSTSANYYFSVLEKYHVPDSVFEQSFVYYASEPKDFEKMYRKVLTKLGDLEQELSGRKQNKLDLGEMDIEGRQQQ